MSTLADMRTRVLDDGAFQTGEASPDLWINRGYRDLVRRTFCYGGIGAARALTGGVGDYDIPGTLITETNILAFDRIWVESGSYGRTSPLRRAEPDTILRARTGAPVQTGLLSRRYAILGTNILMLDPLPNDGDLLAFTYAKRPAPLAGDLDVPIAVPEEYHQALEEYALAHGLRWDGRPDEARDHDAAYMQFASDLRRDMDRFRGGEPEPLRPRKNFRRAWRRDMDLGV